MRATGTHGGAGHFDPAAIALRISAGSKACASTSTMTAPPSMACAPMAGLISFQREAWPWRCPSADGVPLPSAQAAVPFSPAAVAPVSFSCPPSWRIRHSARCAAYDV
jgi:hypothetical protein